MGSPPTDNFDAATQNARELVHRVMTLSDPREAERASEALDQLGHKVEGVFEKRSRWSVLQRETFRDWLFGPMGLVGPIGLVALVVALGLSWIVEVRFAGFLVLLGLSLIAVRLAIVRPDRRDPWEDATPLGGGIVAAWLIRRRGGEVGEALDRRLEAALLWGPDYWHDLAGRALAALPSDRRERIVSHVFSARPSDTWHLLPYAPTAQIVRLALANGPRSSATVDFHAFQSLIRNADITPVLEAIRSGARNQELLLRAVAACGNPQAVDLLIQTLGDRNERLRQIASDGLIAIGPVILPKLLRAFSAGEPELQLAVARTLRGVGADAEVESFCHRVLETGNVDQETAAVLRRILVSRRFASSGFAPAGERPDERLVDALLASIPAPDAAPGLELFWGSGEPLTRNAIAALVAIVTTEGPRHTCPELAAIRLALGDRSRRTLMEILESSGRSPMFAMLLASDQELVEVSKAMSRTRQAAEEWIGVLERHGSLAAIHVLDELWRNGVDGVVQTTAMAALMRCSGQYDDLEYFADRALRGVLRFGQPDSLWESFADGQFGRLEALMINARRMTPQRWKELYHTAPSQSVLWGVYRPDGGLLSPFRLDEDFEAVDEEDETVFFPPEHSIGLVHPAELGLKTRRVWAQLFADYELVPRFEQLQRPVFELDDATAQSTIFEDFPVVAPSGALEAALIRRGWRPDPTDVETVYTLTKPLQRAGAKVTAVIDLDPGFGEDAHTPQQISCLAFWEGHHHVFSPVVTKMQLGAVTAVILSEILYELRTILGSCSTDSASREIALLGFTRGGVEGP